MCKQAHFPPVSLCLASQGVSILSVVSLLWKLSIFTFSSDRSKQPSYVFIQPNSSLYMICPENISIEGSEVMWNSVWFSISKGVKVISISCFCQLISRGYRWAGYG